MSDLPEPLRLFDASAPGVADALAAVDVAHAVYTHFQSAGRILPNSVEALRVELTYHSNAIEGSTLTLRETQLVLEGRSPPGGKPLREIYEARNHDRALRLIESWAATRGSSTPLSEADMLEVHAQVLADIDRASAGRFRTERVLIKGSRYVPPGSHHFSTLLPHALRLVARPGAHPALCAAELHYNIVAIHPFNDGNGRTARLLMNDHLLRRGYPHTIVEVERRAEYLAALEEANAGRCDRFAIFILECVEASIRRLVGPA